MSESPSIVEVVAALKRVILAVRKLQTQVQRLEKLHETGHIQERREP
jgi:hypothetical protein